MIGWIPTLSDHNVETPKTFMEFILTNTHKIVPFTKKYESWILYQLIHSRYMIRLDGTREALKFCSYLIDHIWAKMWPEVLEERVYRLISGQRRISVGNVCPHSSVIIGKICKIMDTWAELFGGSICHKVRLNSISCGSNLCSTWYSELNLWVDMTVQVLTRANF